MSQLPFIEAELTLLTESEGGRKYSLDLTKGHYRPHIVVGDPNQRRVVVEDGNVVEQYLGVQFRNIPKVIKPGETATVTMDLIYYPEVSYIRVKPGVQFTLREGGSIVGYGLVKSLSSE